MTTKKFLTGAALAALLIAAGGCESTSSDQRADTGDYRYDRNARANTSEGDLGAPRPQGNFDNQTNSTAWQDNRTGQGSDRAGSNTNAGMNDRSSANSGSGTNGSSGTGNVNANANASDQEFYKNAAIGGMYEVQAGQIALQKSDSAKIRDIANMLVNDHTNANNELKKIAQQKNINLPTELDSKHRDLITQLEKADKASFDQEFLRQQAQAHRETIRLFEDQTKNGKDDQAKQFATNTLPKLQQHLDQVENRSNTASEK
jgi:putative membrane protein